MLRIYYILHLILIVSAVFNDTSCDPDGEDFNIYVNGLNIKPTTQSCYQFKRYTYGYHVGEEISISLRTRSSIPYTLECDSYSLQKIEFKYERPNIIANPPLLMTEEFHKTYIDCNISNETEADLFTFSLQLVNADAFYPKIDTSNVAVLQEYMISIYYMYLLVEYSPNEKDIVSIRVSGETMVYCHLQPPYGSLRLDFSRDNIKDLYITKVSGPNFNNRTISCLSGDNELLIHLIKRNQSYDGNDNGRTNKDGIEPLSYTRVSELEPKTIPTSLGFLGFIVTVVVVSLVVGGAATYFYYRRRNQKINANMANNGVNQSAPASADPDYPTFCGNPAYDVNYSAINVDPEDSYHFYHEIASRQQ